MTSWFHLKIMEAISRAIRNRMLSATLETWYTWIINSIKCKAAIGKRTVHDDQTSVLQSTVAAPMRGSTSQPRINTYIQKSHTILNTFFLFNKVSWCFDTNSESSVSHQEKWLILKIRTWLLMVRVSSYEKVKVCNLLQQQYLMCLKWFHWYMSAKMSVAGHQRKTFKRWRWVTLQSLSGKRISMLRKHH